MLPPQEDVDSFHNNNKAVISLLNAKSKLLESTGRTGPSYGCRPWRSGVRGAVPPQSPSLPLF